MSLATNISNLATRIGTECKSLRTLINGNVADLSALTTTDKTNLVAAVNELKALIDAADGAVINDAATATTSTWSSQKISDELTTTLNSILDGSPAALDTLNELAAAIGDDANFAATVTTALGNRLRVDAVQTLTAPQQLQGRDNLGVYSKDEIGDPETNFVTVFNTAVA